MESAVNNLLLIIIWVVVGSLVLLILATLAGFGSEKVKKDNIIEVWSTLLPGQAKKRDVFLDLVQQEFKRRNLSYEISDITPDQTNPDNYIAVRQEDGYSVYTGAVIKGTDLHVNWSLEEKNSTGCLGVLPIIVPSRVRS